MPGLLVYMLSFMVVGIYWSNHHHLLRAADRISSAAMWQTWACLRERVDLVRALCGRGADVVVPDRRFTRS
jgi:Endosomal/lysosomal potassium channel TMEM175